MPSAIDITQPEAGNASTAAVRSNFAAAKTELEALQDLATSGPRIIAMFPGDLAPLVGKLPWRPRLPVTLTRVVVVMGTAPTVAATFNLRKNNLAIFADPLPTVAIGQTESAPLVFDLDLDPTDTLTIDCNAATGAAASVLIDYNPR